MAGLEIHAHAMATLLENAFVRQAPAWVNSLVLGLMALLAYFIATACSLRYVVSLVALALALSFVANVWLFSDAALNIELIAPLLAMILVTLCAVTERGWREERERKRVRSALDQYVSPQLAASGAPTGIVTLVFADMENSSTLSESHGAAFEKVRTVISACCAMRRGAGTALKWKLPAILCSLFSRLHPMPCSLPLMHSFRWRANRGPVKWEQFACASECIPASRLWAATATVSRIAARRQIARRVSLPLLAAVKYC
jgi:hypothetical protein